MKTGLAILRRSNPKPTRAAAGAAASMLTSGVNSTSGLAVATASVAPSANKLALLAVNWKNSSSTNPANLASVTGNDLTWVLVASILYDAASITRGRIAVYRAMGPAPTAGAVTMTPAESGFAMNFTWVLTEFGNVDTSGIDGSGAVVQAATAAGTTNTPSVTLAAFTSPANATFGACGHVSTSPTFTPGTGFTKLAEANASSPPNCACAAQFRTDNDTTVDGTLVDGSVGWGMIGVEVKAA